MSTNTDTLPGAIPAGVTHTISRAFLLDGETKAKLEEGDPTHMYQTESQRVAEITVNPSKC